MRRREFITLAGGMAVWPLAARAQQPTVNQPTTKKRLAVIGFGKVTDLTKGGHPYATIYFEELERLGYVEGENLLVERYQFRPDGVAELAREVVDTRPDVIVCYGLPMTISLKKLTSTIPIAASTGDPVRFGLISSLAHPGGNITGVSMDAGVEIWGKRLELLSRAVPKLTKVLYVSTQGGWDGAGGQSVRSAAQGLGISLVRATLNAPYNEAELRRALSTIQRDQLDGVVVAHESQLFDLNSLLVQLIQQMRLPAIFPYSEQAEAGGLMSYSYNVKSAIREQVAQIVDILGGANPADMPYVQATRFELVINLKTARELGLEIPAGLVAGATAVIE